MSNIPNVANFLSQGKGNKWESFSETYTRCTARPFSSSSSTSSECICENRNLEHYVVPPELANRECGPQKKRNNGFSARFRLKRGRQKPFSFSRFGTFLVGLFASYLQ